MGTQIRVVGFIILILTIGAGWLYSLNQRAAQIHAHYAVVLANIAEKTAKAAKAYRKQEQTWQKAVEKESENGKNRVLKAESDARRARAESDRLRGAYRNSLTAALTATATSSPAGSTGNKNPAATNLHSELFGRIDETAGELAEYADKLRAVGLTCEATSDVTQ